MSGVIPFAAGAHATGLLSIVSVTVEPALANIRHDWLHKFPVEFCDASATLETYVRSNQNLDFCVDYVKYSGVDVGDIVPSQFWFTRLVDNKLDFEPARNKDQMTPFADQWRMMQFAPSMDEILVMLNREYITDDCANWMMKRHGAVDPALRDKFKELRFEIPGPGDMVRFGVREVFHPPAVVEHGYAEEYPTVLNEYMAFQGFGQKTKTMFPDAKDTNGNAVPAHLATWGEIFWAAHWNPPSAGQGYEMFQRYYTVSRYGPSPDVLDDNGDINGGRVFTEDNLRLLLRVNDYPQPFRDKLIGIAYTPLGIRALRQLVVEKLISKPDTYHAFRAQGYNDRNANMQTELLWKEKTSKIDKTIKEAFDIGIITKDQAYNALIDDGTDNDEALRLTRLWELDRQYLDTKNTLISIKRAYMGGVVGDRDLIGVILQAGVEQGRANQLALNWRMSRTFDRRQVTASKIIDWYMRYIIGEDDVTARLQNLNFDGADISNMLASANQDMGQKKAKQIEQKQAKQDKQQKKQQQQKQQQAKQEKPPKIPARKYPTDADLKKWYSSGIITEDYARKTLYAQNMQKADVDSWLESNKPKG